MGREGFAFTNAFTPTAICTPARASLLTGKRPGKHQVLANPEWNIAYRVSIPEGTWTYTQELRDAGYNVGIVGKYHCGHNLPGKFGADDDTFWGAENPVANEEYAAWLDERGLPPVRAHDLWRGKLPGGRYGHILAARLDQPEEATFERFLADRAITRLRQYAADWKEARRPFCLDVHFFGPHLPYFLPDEWFDLIDPADVELPESFGDPLIGKPPIQLNYATYWSTSSFTNEQWKKLIAVYWGYVAMIDFEIGRIMDEARELGVLDDTAVFFCADHGEFTGAHRLNDKGPMMYDDIYNIPFIARIPGVSAVGRSTAFVSLIDLPAPAPVLGRVPQGPFRPHRLRRPAQLPVRGLPGLLLPRLPRLGGHGAPAALGPARLRHHGSGHGRPAGRRTARRGGRLVRPCSLKRSWPASPPAPSGPPVPPPVRRPSSNEAPAISVRSRSSTTCEWAGLRAVTMGSMMIAPPFGLRWRQ